MSLRDGGRLKLFRECTNFRISNLVKMRSHSNAREEKIHSENSVHISMFLQVD